jgi:hypothetical protein
VFCSTAARDYSRFARPVIWRDVIAESLRKQLRHFVPVRHSDFKANAEAVNFGISHNDGLTVDFDSKLIHFDTARRAQRRSIAYCVY